MCIAPTTIGTPVSADTAAIRVGLLSRHREGLLAQDRLLAGPAGGDHLLGVEPVGAAHGHHIDPWIGEQLLEEVEERAPTRPATAPATSAPTSETWVTVNTSSSRASAGRWMAWVTGPPPDESHSERSFDHGVRPLHRVDQKVSDRFDFVTVSDC